MDELVIATGNPHKVSEIAAMLRPAGIRTLSLNEAGGPFPEPEEHGSTFRDNAAIKATAYAKLTGRWCLADDSGLEIDALRGAPGVISSHYSSDGEERGLARAERDAANNQRVLKELEGVAPSDRSARFICQMVLADPSGNIRAETLGTFEGRIGEPPRVPAGEHGFGYDPIFLVGAGFERTGAELPPEEKAARSHRGAALRAMVEQIRSGLPPLA